MAIIPFVFILCQGCKKDNIDNTNYADKVLNYAPYQKGSSLYYKVDSTYYDDFKDTTFTVVSYKKLTIDSLDNGLSGRTLFRVVVSETYDTQTPFRFKRVDQWAITNYYFETQVHNQRFTHLIFPINFESVWNVNEYGNKREQLRYYTALDDTFKMDNKIYQNAIKAENEPKKNNVIDFAMKEVYVKKIGMIYKKTINIETQFNKPFGISVTETLYDYKL